MSKAIYWFRNNLRLHDNPSLAQAMRENEEVIPVVVLPPEQSTTRSLGFANWGVYRKKFYLETIQDLQSHLAQQGGQLVILQGDAVDCMLELAMKASCERVYASHEPGFNEQAEERAVGQKLHLVTAMDGFLIREGVLPFSLEKLPFGFSAFRKKVEANWRCGVEIEIPEFKWSSSRLDSMTIEIPEVQTDQRSAHPFVGGEQYGLDRLKDYLWETNRVQSYKWTRNGLIGVDYSSKLSGFLAVGALSPVHIYREVERYERERKQNVSTYWLKFELLWRQFFRFVSLKYGNRLFLLGGIQKKERDWDNDQTNFIEWCEGRTGDEFVDANMRELNATGFMSNRGRQNAASYLAHDLGLDWRLGAGYFEQHLIDYDVSSNWCNWMYVASVVNDSREHKFDTKWQAQNYDPKVEYRRLWVR